MVPCTQTAPDERTVGTEVAAAEAVDLVVVTVEGELTEVAGVDFGVGMLLLMEEAGASDALGEAPAVLVGSDAAGCESARNPTMFFGVEAGVSDVLDEAAAVLVGSGAAVCEEVRKPSTTNGCLTAGSVLVGLEVVLVIILVLVKVDVWIGVLLVAPMLELAERDAVAVAGVDAP